MKHFAVLIVLMILVTACSPQAAVAPTVVPEDSTAVPAATEDPSITITDALGRTVTLQEPPQRIVLTGKALFMIADAAYLFPGAADTVVGFGNTGQGSGNFIQLIDPDYESKASLESEAGAEQVAALQPDLVIMKSYLADSVGAPIEALDIPVVYVDFETPEQYERDLGILGQIFGDDDRVAEIITFYQDKTNAVAQVVDGAEKPNVLLLYYNNKDGNIAFNVPPMGWMQTQMVEMAGGQPIWADANPGNGWTQVTLEQIAAWDADKIFLISYFASPTEVVAGLKEDPNWQAIRAVEEDQIYAFPVDLYSWDQPDPRWILGLTWLADKLHPELYSDFDMLAEVKTFYNTLFGLDDAFVEENIVPTFDGVLP